MNTAAKEGEGYMMTSHFTSLVTNGSSAPESGQSTPTPPTTIQNRSTRGAFSGSLKLGFDGKTDANDATAIPSVHKLQPTPTSLFAFPSGNENLLQQNTEHTGADYEHVHTVPSQHEEKMQRNDTKNYEDQYVSFVTHTETNIQPFTISASASFSTPGEVENHAQQDGKSETTTLEANYGLTTPQYVPLTPLADMKNFKEQCRTAPTKEVGTSMTSPSASFKTPDGDEVMWQNGESNSTKVEASYHNDAETTTQDVDFIPSTDTNNLKGDVDEFNATISSSSQEPGTSTISPSVLGAEEGLPQKNGETTAASFEANYDGTGPTTPHYEHFTSRTSTNNSNEQDGKFSTTTDSSALETGRVPTSPSALSVVPNNDASGTQQNGEPTVTTFEVESNAEVTTTPQYDDFTLRTTTKNSTVQDDEFSTTTVSSAQEIGTTTTSPTKLFTIPNNDVSGTQQKGEPTAATFESGNDAEASTIPQYADFIHRTDTKKSSEQDDIFNAIPASSAHGVELTTISPLKLFTIPNDGEGLRQKNVEATATTFQIDYDGIQQDAPLAEHITPPTGTKNFTEEAGEIESNMPSSSHGILPTSSFPSMRLPGQADNDNCTQQECDSVGTTVTVYPEDNLTTMSSLTPVAVPVDGGNIKEHSGGPNITLSPEPNKDESAATPWFPPTINGNNLTLQINKCKGSNLGTNQEKHSPMSFLAIFQMLAGINDNSTLMCDEPGVTATPPTNEETSYNTTAKQDTTTISKDEAVDGSKTKSYYPSYNGSSLDELLMLYELHTTILKIMSIILGAAVALILLIIGYEYCRKHRRGDRTAVSPHTAEPHDAGQPSTSQASTSEEPIIRFRDLLSREENN
ncbi:mucin-22-like [Schistocerca piceifrons]|uniref:mucin-22-like n=1 Tax=Schistocerca piceifrons TaxID=274613 RepID=UPI001F5FB7C6|nr:mucin-22-like [Schistocerca piceifrons]